MTAGSAAKVGRLQIVGVTLGNALEFYDFLIFSFFAIQIGQTFFPATNPINSLLAALATFGAGFLTRPIGAIYIGRLGDRIGRRPAMLLSFALIGVSSLGVALVPSHAAIGMAAPVLVIVCRLVQGFALGGEVGPSSAFLAEIGPDRQRGYYISLQYASQGVAVLASGLVGVALASVMNDAALASWGWRIAIALGVVIVPVGLVLRRSLPETREAERIVPAFRSYAGIAAFAFVTMASATIMNYVLSYLSTFAQTILHLSPGVALGSTIMVGLGNVVGSLAGGLLSDRWGRRPLMIWPLAACIAMILPGFLLIIHYPGPASLYGVTLVLRTLSSVAATTAFVVVAETLPRGIRSGAIAIFYAFAIAVFGGSAQFIVAWLTDQTGNALAPGWYMLAAAVVGLAAMLAIKETAPRLLPRPA